MNMKQMPSLPAQTGPFIWGALLGAAALAIAGFTWGGWVSDAKADRLAGERATAATMAALTPICVAQFQGDPKAAAKMSTFKETQSWEQADFVRHGGWATMPGSTGEPSRELANACAEALNKL